MYEIDNFMGPKDTLPPCGYVPPSRNPTPEVIIIPGFGIHDAQSIEIPRTRAVSPPPLAPPLAVAGKTLHERDNKTVPTPSGSQNLPVPEMKSTYNNQFYENMDGSWSCGMTGKRIYEM